jgi:hypothetical protein
MNKKQIHRQISTSTQREEILGEGERVGTTDAVFADGGGEGALTSKGTLP